MNTAIDPIPTLVLGIMLCILGLIPIGIVVGIWGFIRWIRKS